MVSVSVSANLQQLAINKCNLLSYCCCDCNYSLTDAVKSKQDTWLITTVNSHTDTHMEYNGSRPQSVGHTVQLTPVAMS